MTVLKEQISSERIAEAAVAGMQDRKAKDICIVDLRNIGNAMCDYFVICHGTSNTNVEAIADSVEDEIRKNLKEKPFHKEGKDNSEWILLDYFDVVVHVFQKEKRDFFGLEELWADAPITYFEDEN